MFSLCLLPAKCGRQARTRHGSILAKKHACLPHPASIAIEPCEPLTRNTERLLLAEIKLGTACKFLKKFQSPENPVGVVLLPSPDV